MVILGEPMMRRRLLPLLALLALLFTSCAIEQAADLPSPRPGAGRIFLYMSVPQRPGLDIRFTLSRVSFLNNLDQWVDVPLQADIDTERLAVNQVKASEFDFAPGQYGKIKLVVSDPVLIRDKQPVPLVAPQPDGEVVMDLEFSLSKGESLALFVGFRPDESISGKDKFVPVFSVMKQSMEIKDLLLYVACSKSNSVIIIDRQQDQVVGAVGVGESPSDVAVGPDNDRVYVANRGSNNISVVNTTSHKVDKTIGNFGYSPYRLAISADGRWLFAVNPSSDNVTVIDTTRDVVVETISVDRNPMGIVYDPDRNRVYVSNSDSNTVSVIDVSSLQVIRTVAVDIRPRGLAVQDDKIYVSNWGSSNISVIDLSSYTVEKFIPVGPRPHWVVSGLSDRIYLSKDNSNEISIIYPSMNVVTHTIPVGRSPENMSVDSLRRKLYVVNYKSDDVSVIDISTKKVISTIQVGYRPQGIAAIQE
jgi:YVTN family beta-propeller protein